MNDGWTVLEGGPEALYENPVPIGEKQVGESGRTREATVTSKEGYDLPVEGPSATSGRYGGVRPAVESKLTLRGFVLRDVQMVGDTGCKLVYRF